MPHDTIITAAMIEAERLRALAESYESAAAWHETKAAECEQQGRHARAAYHRQSAEHDRVQAVRWREAARREESAQESQQGTQAEETTESEAR